MRLDATLPALDQLKFDQAFSEEYHKKLMDKTFIQSVIYGDLLKKDHRQSANLLFVLAYFESKLELKDVVANSDIWARKVGTVGSAWITELIEGLKADVEEIALHMSRSYASCFAYVQVTDATSETMSVHDKGEFQHSLFVKNVPSSATATTAAVQQVKTKIEQVGRAASLNWQAVQDHVWQQLDVSASKLQDAVGLKAAEQTSSKVDSYGLGWSGSTTTFTTGQSIASIIDKGKDSGLK